MISKISFSGLVYFYLILQRTVHLAISTPDSVKIGALLHEDDVLRRNVFVHAVHKLNVEGRKPVFTPLVQSISTHDPLETVEKACVLLLSGSLAVLDGSEAGGRAGVGSVCEGKEIPHLPLLPLPPPPSFALLLHPAPSALGHALAVLIRYYRWKSFVLLYQDIQGLYNLEEVLELSSGGHGARVIVRELSGSGDERPLLKEVKDRMDQFHIVVDADVDTSTSILEDATALGMTGDYYHYLFTNLDLYTLDLAMYKEGDHGCNVTGYRLVDVESKQTKALVQELRALPYEDGPMHLPPIGIPTEVGVLVDGVGLLGVAVEKMGDFFPPSSLSCDGERTWRNGSSFKNELRVINDFKGITGKFRLDANGVRESYVIKAIELGKKGFEELGYWESETKELVITRKYTDSLQAAVHALENKTLIVTVHMEEPFVMYRASEKPLEGNERYEGYCIDLLSEIAKILKFNYTIQEVKDKAYGSLLPNGQWNGMVGELVRGEADLAAASLTISYSRSEVVDFTVPFMHLGISILFKKPTKKPPALFTFLSPLSLDVWIYMLAAYVGVSLVLWILARFSPYEWISAHPCNPNRDVVENQFNLLNSLWFTVGSLMQQGSDLAPKAPSTRLVAGIWWLFCLILISSYTANLAAFLTVERMVSPIESPDDVAKQTTIKYGTLNSGSTKSFFMESRIQTYERMWAFMESEIPSVFVNTSQEGILRVEQGEYAYLMESSMLEYYVERKCDLVQVGGLIDSKDSPYREAISSAILKLQENTILTSLKQTWWKEKRGGGRCTKDEAKGSANALGLQNVGGVFVLLLGGTVLAVLLGLMEFFWKRRTRDVVWEELQFAMKCDGSNKPVRRGGGREEGTEEETPSHHHKYPVFLPAHSDAYLFHAQE